MNDVSVIVPVFHGSEYIKRMIAQIEACQIYLRNMQKGTNIELILVNDAPDENLQAETSSYIHVAIYNTGENRGIHGARVYGLYKSKGGFVLFLDQDDIIYSDYIYSQLLLIEEADAVVCRCIHEGKEFYNADLKFEDAVCKEYMMTKGNAIVSPGQVLLRRSSIPNVWQENIMNSNCSDDYLLWLCMLAENCRFALNQRILYEHIVDGRNLSLDYKRMVLSDNEMFMILKENRVFDEESLKKISDMLNQAVLERIAFLEKFRRMFIALNKMIMCREAGCSVGGYIKRSGIRKAAIYGDGYLGKRLMAELEEQHIEVSFFIDRNADYLEERVPVYRLENAPEGIDAVIVSLVQNAESVKGALERKYAFKIYTVTEVIEQAMGGGNEKNQNIFY